MDLIPTMAHFRSQKHTHDRQDGIEREMVTYRAPGDRPWPNIVRATRGGLAALLLGLGQRLSDQPRPATEPKPPPRTP